MLWILITLSTIGLILNVKKNSWCFVLWIISNVGWAYVNFKSGLQAQGWQFVIYTAFTVWGAYEWTREVK